MSFATLAVSLAGPIVKRALVALGVGVISYAAVTAAFTQVQSTLISLFGTASSNVIWMIDAAGFLQGVGIVLGAYSAKLSLQTLTRFGKLQS